MALADTARLVASLELQDKFSAPLGRAEGALARAESTIGRTSGRFGPLTSGFAAAGGAVTTFGNKLALAGSRIRGLVLGPAGLLGLTGGLFGIATVLRSSFESLNELQSVQAQTAAAIKSTGDAAHVTTGQIRELSEALEDQTTVDDKVIQKAANLLLTFTGIQNRVGAGNDIFNQATKAVVDMSVALDEDASSAAIQLGKALNDPIRGITALRRVGIQFTDQQVAQVKAFLKQNDLLSAQKLILAEVNKEFGGSGAASANTYAAAQRRLADAVEDAEIALAQGLVPGLTNVSKALATAFRDPSFVRGASELGMTISGVLSPENIANAGRLASAVGGIFGKVAEAWAAVPDPVKQLLIGGFVANKVTKFLFDVSIKDIFKGGLDLFGKLRGSTPATPLFVADVTGGLGKGAGGGLLGGVTAGGLAKLIGGAVAVAVGNQLISAGVGTGGPLGAAQGALGGAATIAGGAIAFGPIGAILGSILGVVTTQQAESAQNSKIAQGLQETTNKYLAQQPTRDQLLSSLSAVDQGISDITSNPLNTLVQGDALDKLKGMRTDIANQLANSNIGVIQGEHAGQTNAEALAETKQLSQNVKGLKVPLDALHKQFHADLATLIKANKPQDFAKIADRLATSVLKGVGSAAGTRNIIAELRKKREVALDAKDYAAVRAIDAAIKKVESKLPGREFVARELAEARKIASGTLKNADKITGLQAIMRVLKDRGDIHAANLIRNKINELKGTTAKAGRDTAAAARQAAAAIRAKKLAFINNTTVNVSTVVSASAIRHVTTTYNRYGTQVE